MKLAFRLLLPLVAAFSLLDPPGSEAVPAFARREGVNCQMCHSRVPELNEDGHAYLRRGLREERGGMSPGMDMGKEMAEPPVAAASRPLGEPLPLSWSDYFTVMGHHGLEVRRHSEAVVDAGTIDAWIGGPFNRQWSGLANPVLDTEAGGADVELAYGQFITSWSERFGTLRFGQLMPLVILFNQGGPAMPLTAPVVLSSPTSVQNPWMPSTLLRGLELGVVNLPRWNAYVGAGQPQIDDLVGASHTDVYASVEYLIGEKGAFSGFGYKGEIAASSGQPSVDYDRVALFANAYLPRTKGVLGFLWGRDRPAGGKSLDTAGGFLLGEVMLAERWAGYARYDYASWEVPVGDAETTDGPTIGVSFWAQTQVRLTLESQFLKSTGTSRDRSAIAELMWVF